jgi:hypothetical protein
LGSGNAVKLLMLLLRHGNPLYRYLDTAGVQLDCWDLGLPDLGEKSTGDAVFLY